MHRLSILALLAILANSAIPAQADVLDIVKPRKFGYILKVSRAASYQLSPGDFLDVGVRSGTDPSSASAKVIRRVQVLRIHETGNTVSIVLAMNRQQVRSMQIAMTQPQAVATLRIVKKQPRSAPTGYTEDDGIADLEFENDINLAQNQN